MSELSAALLDRDTSRPETYSLALIAGSDDEATFLLAGAFPGRRGRSEACAFYAVIHRRFGTWTHLYRVVPDDPLHGFTVYLEKAFAGEAVTLAHDWLRAVFER